MKPHILKAACRSLLLGFAAAALAGGCAGSALHRSRAIFYTGRMDEADQALSEGVTPTRDRVLFHMERGMIRQALQDFEASSRDLIQAATLIEQIESYSVSQGAASMVVNDTVQEFAGLPFERSILHAMTSLNFLALGRWNDAAVGARRLLESLADEVRGDFPDSPFLRYLAGLCFELIDDPSNAALQYRKASDLSPDLEIDAQTGRIRFDPNPTNSVNFAAPSPWPLAQPAGRHELVLVLMTGRAPYGPLTAPMSPYLDEPVYADILWNSNYLGRTWILADTYQMATATARIVAARKAAKSTARIVLKDTIADAAGGAADSDAIGELVRMILIGLLERPDERRWETLPHRIHVARLPCPADLDHYEIVFRRANGSLHSRHEVRSPLSRRRAITFSLYRLMP